MSSLNRVQLLGRLGKDPESRNTNYGTVANFSLATTESWKDSTSGERKEATEWHNCVAWKATADIITKYTHKGDQVFIEGKLKTRSWEKDGVTRYVTEVHVEKVILLGGKRESNNGGYTSGPSQSTQPAATSTASDDLPF